MTVEETRLVLHSSELIRQYQRKAYRESFLKKDPWIFRLVNWFYGNNDIWFNEKKGHFFEYRFPYFSVNVELISNIASIAGCIFEGLKKGVLLKPTYLYAMTSTAGTASALKRKDYRKLAMEASAYVSLFFPHGRWVAAGFHLISASLSLAYRKEISEKAFEYVPLRIRLITESDWKNHFDPKKVKDALCMLNFQPENELVATPIPRLRALYKPLEELTEEIIDERCAYLVEGNENTIRKIHEDSRRKGPSMMATFLYRSLIRKKIAAETLKRHLRGQDTKKSFFDRFKL